VTEEAATAEQTLDAAVRKITRAVTDLIQADPHQWSTRPCQTCQAVSAIVGYPFGCVVKRQRAAGMLDSRS
jgi:hypothetical protein